jgi:hypothetical protein
MSYRIVLSKKSNKADRPIFSTTSTFNENHAESTGFTLHQERKTAKMESQQRNLG